MNITIRCWLKNNVTTPVPDECCVSGVRGGETVLASGVKPEVLKRPLSQPMLGQPVIIVYRNT